MARSAEEILEFDQLRALLRARTTCAPGRGAVESLGFRTDRRELEGEFALIAEAMAYLRSGEELGFGGLADPEAWLERLTLPGAVLAPAELLDAASAVDTITSLREKFRETSAKFPLLSARSRALPDLRFLAVAVRRAILPGGEISDSASLALRRLRDGIGRTRETLETVEINNQLLQLREEETAEIARILEELTGKLVAEHAPLAHAVSTIAEMDAIFARARFAREYDCCVPEFTDEAAIALDAARHPVLESALRPQGRPVVPLSLSLGKIG